MKPLEPFKGGGGWRATRANLAFLAALFVVFVILVVVWWVLRTQGEWTDGVDSFFALPVGALTLILAGAIGWNNMRRTWIESLPWVLCVRLRKPSSAESRTLETFAVLEDIPLAAPANAREWAQNLTTQLSTDQRLKLGLFEVDTVDRLLASDERRMCITLKLSTPEFNFKENYKTGKVWIATDGIAALQENPQQPGTLDAYWDVLSGAKPASDMSQGGSQ